MAIDPRQRLSVTLTLEAAAWTEFLARLHEWPYRLAVQVIGQTAPQLREAEPEASEQAPVMEAADG